MSRCMRVHRVGGADGRSWIGACAAATRRLGLARVGLVGVLAAAVLAPGFAVAEPRIWATAGPADTGDAGPIALPDGVHTLHLWASGGSTPSLGPPCEASASGDEICGVAFELRALGNFVLQDFVGDPAFDSGPSALAFRVHGLPGPLMRANNLDLGVPGVENRHLGVLVVGGADTATSSIEVSGRIITANLEMQDVASGTLVVPEPGIASGLACGLAALACAMRGRARRRECATRAPG